MAFVHNKANGSTMGVSFAQKSTCEDGIDK